MGCTVSRIRAEALVGLAEMVLMNVKALHRVSAIRKAAGGR